MIVSQGKSQLEKGLQTRAHNPPDDTPPPAGYHDDKLLPEVRLPQGDCRHNIIWTSRGSGEHRPHLGRVYPSTCVPTRLECSAVAMLPSTVLACNEVTARPNSGP